MARDHDIGRSVDAILREQRPVGSFPASPDFSQYTYCWLRDGSFIAHALDHAGHHERARRFYEWAAAAIDGESGIIHRALALQSAGKPLDPASMPPARFALDGRVVADEWPNYQIDGYGTWLWGLEAHLQAEGAGRVPDALRSAVALTAQYLDAFSLEPCFDVWEESGGGSAIHTSTLACVWAGLDAAARLLEDAAYESRARAIEARVRGSLGTEGWFVKSTSRADVDASTIWLSAPLGLIAADDRAMTATVAEVERTLMLQGGVRRFADDNYFGGGAWPVLTCSLGLHYVRAGRADDARRCLDWTLDRFTADGRLGEQFFGELRRPEQHDKWVAQWGPPAVDLLWSHAMFVLLALELDSAEAGAASSLVGES